MAARWRGADFEERRRYPREPVPRVRLHAPVRGEVVDIGRGGMRVETGHALTVGARSSFTIGDPPHALARLRCLVRWCRFTGSRTTDDGGAQSVFRAGVAFLGMDGEPPGAEE